MHTGLHIDLCKNDAINGPGAFALIMLVYLAILLIIAGVISVALKLFKHDRSLGIILASIVVFGAMGLAFFVGGLLNMYDCGLTAY